MRKKWGITIYATIMLLLSLQSKAHGQFSEPCRAPHPQGFREAVSLQTGKLFEFVPSLCVSERYDSNVFFRPATKGLKREDYVTSVNPSLRINHNGNYAAGFLDVEGISETYVNNSGLNFLGSNGTFSFSLDNTIRKIIPNASLFISDAVRYAPLPPGFVNPAAGTNPGAPGNIQDVFSQGILFQRANRITNNGTVTASYATSSSTRVEASYSHALLRFLVPSAGLFDTTTQIGTIGGIAELSAVDRLNVRYSFAHSEFGGATGPAVSFKSHTATAGWSRILTPNLTAEAGGGGIVIDPGRTTYAANTAITFNYATTKATLSYARSAFPSFSGVPTQLVGNVVSLSATQQITQEWELIGSANYSHSSGTQGATPIKFDSYGGSLNLAYFISRIWSTALGYSYIRFSRDFGVPRDQFDRHVVMFSVRASWE